MKTRFYLLLCTLVSLVSAQAANIAFLSFHTNEFQPTGPARNYGFTTAPDAGYTQLLTQNGHSVTRFVTVDNFNVSQLAGFDLVILSRSAASGHYQATNETAAWNGLSVPMIIINGYLVRGGGTAGNVRLGLMAGSTIPDTDGPIRLRVNAPGHPVFAGVALGSNDVMVNTYSMSGTNGGSISTTNGTLQRGISVVTGAPAGGGVVLATVAADRNAAGGTVVAEWLAGSVLSTAGRGGGATNDVLGGHRLLLLTGSREFGTVPNNAPSDVAGIYDLTPDGAQLLLNAVNYMTSTRISIRTVNTVNNESPGPGETSLAQALSNLQDGDYVRFAIPGNGPHTIVTPIGGYPLITNHNVIIDGFTQPGSTPNTNPILGGNNAQQRIILDSTGADSLPNPDPNFPNRPLRRSTRLDFPTFVGNTGYGDSENCILGVFEADNVTIRGLSFIARPTTSDTADPSIYCVAFIKQATNGHVSGCLFGMAPGGTTTADLRPPAAAVAAFRWRIGGDVFSDYLVAGTDGDGFNDRAEFNVMLGCRIALALELTGARVSGNYGNVFPNGNTFPDIDALYREQIAIAGGATLEFMENGRVSSHTIVGTDGDGVSDADERNIIAHSIYKADIEFYSNPATNIVVAGNYFGVGVNGVTRSPASTNAARPNLLDLPSVSSVRIGSNGDGVSDALEGNLIAHAPGSVIVNQASSLVFRGNTMTNNNYGSLFSSTAPAPVLNSLSNNILSGSMTVPSGDFVTGFIDLYAVDPVALARSGGAPPITHPGRLLGTFVDNSPADLDPTPGLFRFDITSLGLADTTYVTIAVTYSSETTASNVGRAATSSFVPPVAKRPRLTIEKQGLFIILTWIAPDNAYVVQVSEVLDQANPNTWLEFFPHTHTSGLNVSQLDYDSLPNGKYFFRLISQ